MRRLPESLPSIERVCIEAVDGRTSTFALELPYLDCDEEAAANEEACTPIANNSAGGENDFAADKQVQSQKPRPLVWRPSAFKDRAEVLMFSKSASCSSKSLGRAEADPSRVVYVKYASSTPYLALRKTLERGGVYRTEDDSDAWSLFWTSQVTMDLLRGMKAYQKTNHFLGSENLGRKDLLGRNLRRMEQMFGQEFQIAPTSFVFPRDFLAWQVCQFHTARSDAVWIWKPCNGRCGRSIVVLCPSANDKDLKMLKELSVRRGILQKYIHEPLLLQGYKFDLRVYVVVTSYNPLKVYVYKEGLVRLATKKYSADLNSLDCRTMHLTNYSVNKHSPDFVQNLDGRDDAQGSSSGEPGAPSKWSFKELRGYFEAHGHDFDVLFERIDDLVIKTLIAVESSIRRACCADGVDFSKRCFEMYGFDVLVDSSLKPWLLEVNVFPSLRMGSPLDRRIKLGLTASLLSLVGLQSPHNRETPSRFHRSQHEDRMATILASMDPESAVAAFDDEAWEIIKETYDEELRSGGLRRIFPDADSDEYTHFFQQELFGNVVLRKSLEFLAPLAEQKSPLAATDGPREPLSPKGSNALFRRRLAPPPKRL